jgi:hypothetical protein
VKDESTDKNKEVISQRDYEYNNEDDDEYTYEQEVLSHQD